MKEPLEKIKVSAGEDLLAFIPHMVGYWPEASVVCIGMAGRQLRATMRLDLPEGDGGATARLAAVASAQMASDADADGCLLAIFAHEDWVDPERQPHARLYGQLAAAFAAHGLPVKDAWYVGARHWRSILCTEAACCPWPGKDNRSIKESFVNAEFIYRGSMVREPPGQQIRELCTPRDAAFVQAVRQAGTPLRDELGAFGAGLAQLATTLGAWEHALSQWPATPDAALTAFLLASLGDATVRDAVMVALASTSGRSLLGAVGLGLVQADGCQQVLVPRNWHGGSQSACCPVAWPEAGEEAVAAAMEGFGRILVGDVPDGGNAKVRAGKKAGRGGRARQDSPALRAARRGRAAAHGGPDWGRLDRSEPLLQFLARATEGADRAPVLCILGWIQWCKGRGTWAGHYFAASMESRPGYRLAGLLDQLLAAGCIAGCAKDRRTAWRGPGAAGGAAPGEPEVA